MENMETLPPKYLKPIIMQGKNSVVQRNVITLPVKIMTAESSATGVEGFTATTTTTTQSISTGGEAFATESYNAGGAEAYTTGNETYETGAEAFTTGTETFNTGSEAFTTGTEEFATGAEFTQELAQPTNFETTQTTTTTTSSFSTGGATGAQPAFKLLRRGSGISPNEQNGIISTAISVLQQGLTPISNNTSRGVKKRLGGDWLVIVYPKDKPIDFNMTCVQGNDYLYFTLDDTAYQVCRLK